MTAKSVRDLFVDALALKRQGIAFREVAQRLIDLGHDSGYRSITEQRTEETVSLRFDEAGVIVFDGTEWSYRNTVP